jgi:hypothetical protein
MKFLGVNIEIKEASEPTDIIWENRHYSAGSRNIKRFVVYIMILIMLCISAAFIFYFTKVSTKLKNKYPRVNCDIIITDYLGSANPLEPISDKLKVRFTDDAMKEFLAN